MHAYNRTLSHAIRQGKHAQRLHLLVENIKGGYHGCVISSKVRPRQIEEHVFSLLRMRSIATIIPAKQS